MTTKPLNMRALDTVRKIAARDGWHDPGTGLKRRGAASRFCNPTVLEDYELADLYEYDWLARKIVRLINEDAWGDSLVFPGPKKAEKEAPEAKEGLEKPKKAVDSADPDAPGSADAAKWAELDHFEGADDGAFLTAAHWARLYDFSLLLLGYDYSGRLDVPVSGTPKLKWLEPIPGPAVMVDYTDLSLNRADPHNYECPEWYRIIGNHRFRDQRIHKSRVVPFYGPAGAGRWIAQQVRGRGSRVYATKGALSALDPCVEIMQEYGLSWNAVSHLLQEASIPVWKLKGLINGLASGDPEGSIQARMQMQQAAMSVHRAVLLDSEGESYDRVAARIQDVPEIIQALSFRLSSAVGYPVGRLFGKIIGGLGDTGDSDRTMHLDNVQSYRTRTLEPRLGIVMKAAGIKEWEFKPLDETTESEALDVKQKYAQTVKTWFDMVGIPEQQLADLCAESLEIDKFVPEEPEPMVLGGVDPLTGEAVEPEPDVPPPPPKAPVKDGFDPDQPRDEQGQFAETGAARVAQKEHAHKAVERIAAAHAKQSTVAKSAIARVKEVTKVRPTQRALEKADEGLSEYGGSLLDGIADAEAHPLDRDAFNDLLLATNEDGTDFDEDLKEVDVRKAADAAVRNALHDTQYSGDINDIDKHLAAREGTSLPDAIEAAWVVHAEANEDADRGQFDRAVREARVAAMKSATFRNTQIQAAREIRASLKETAVESTLVGSESVFQLETEEAAEAFTPRGLYDLVSLVAEGRSVKPADPAKIERAKKRVEKEIKAFYDEEDGDQDGRTGAAEELDDKP